MESILVFKKLEQVRDLPTLPLILDKVRVAIRDPNSDANKIAAIIGDDPAMMARILKVVNSALYGGTGKIESLKMAIARLGFNAVNNLAISTSVFKAFGTSTGADFDRKEFWRHCVSTGIAGVAIMQACRKNLSHRYEKEALHLAGLIHDVGKLVFDQYFHDEFMEALAVSKSEAIPLHRAEYKVFGTDHTAVGAWLAKKWKMSDQLVDCILWHHRPQKAKPEFQELVRIVEVANYICNYRMIGNSGDVSKPACSEDTWKMLKLSEEDYYAIMDEIVAESSKSEVLLSLM